MTGTALSAIVRDAAGRKFVTADGDEHVVRVLPPITKERLGEIEWQAGQRLPAELRELLQSSTGMESELMETVDFARIERDDVPGLFGWLLNVQGDGAGNYWVLELRERMPALGPVWFLCHDASSIVYQSADLATFLADLLRWETTHDGPIREVVEHAVHRIWTQTSDVPHTTLLDSPDPVLRDFARSLVGEWFVADLRAAQVGDGMPTGRYGPKTPLARAGEAFVFAYASRTRWQRFKAFFTGK
jgi:hypothetical protein